MQAYSPGASLDKFAFEQFPVSESLFVAGPRQVGVAFRVEVVRGVAR
jgi:hypothetical protein